MKTLFDKIEESAGYIRSLINTGADQALVLGTGLGAYGDTIKDQLVLPYKEIPHFPVSTVESHEGKLIFGYKGDVPIVAMSGRFHYYEGYSATDLTFPIRVLKALGIKKLIITNAAGGVNPHFREGDIVVINDHINMMPDHPLRGPNDSRLGLRFPDMMHAYDGEMRIILSKIAEDIQIPIRQGVYLGLQGPSLETPAEYRMAHILGADLVGMSTIPEVIVAQHCQIKVAAFSIVSNVCFPPSTLTVTTVEQVIAVVNSASQKLNRILDRYFEKS